MQHSLNNNLNNSLNKEFTVSEISLKIKELLENNFSYVRIRGEISGLKIATSGHGYFNLKDNLNVIACTCWRPILARMSFVLTEGMEVIIFGKISAYGPQSRYQISVEIVELGGVGAMLKLLEERKTRLESEGLFDQNKRKLFPFSKKIGVITSITGAVVRDILHRIADRCPSYVLIWPVTVQGQTASKEISEAIVGFNSMTEKPDLLIIARGGGSIEDLWPFNEEILIRAAYASQIPIISAIGHETDFTLLDFVADLRAPTPTAAAEFAVPVLSTLSHTIDIHHTRLNSAMHHLLKFHDGLIEGYNRTLKQPLNLLHTQQQRLDEISFRLDDCAINLIKTKHAVLASYKISVSNLKKIVDFKSLQLQHQINYISNIQKTITEHLERRLMRPSIILDSFDYNNILKRGFAIVKDLNGKIITSKNRSQNIDKFSVKFCDGEIEVEKVAQKVA